MMLFTGGKTAGHIYPLISLINAMNDKSIFVGYKDSLEEKICKKNNIEFICIKPKKNKYITGIRGYIELKKQLNNRKIDCVVSTGGYVSLSGLLYAYLNNIPLYLIEENVVMGKANKLFSNYAKKVFLTYELNEMKKKYIVTGLPIRKPTYKKLNVNYDVLIIGGSLGSRPLCDIAELVSRYYKVCLIAGKYYDNYIKYDNLEVIEYCDNIYDYMKSSKVIISRGGASTTYEIMSLGIPLVVVPSEKTKDNHQYLNALHLLKLNACRLVREENLRASLLDNISNLINNENTRINMIANQKNIADFKASKRIIEIIKGDLK